MDLFAPISWKGYTIPSRVIFAPINTGYTRNGLPEPRLIRFHSDRSGTSIGISMLGNVAINADSTSNNSTAVFSNEKDVNAFSAVSGAIREKGSLAGIQLASSLPELAPDKKWKCDSREKEILRLSDLVASFSPQDMETKFRSFENSARLSKLAGFDLIQVHAAHGYFLSLLLNPVINKRGDDFRQSGPRVDEFIQSLRSICGNTLLSFRINGYSGLADFASEESSALDLATRLSQLGADVIDLSAGMYTLDRHLIYPAIFPSNGLPNLNLALQINNTVRSMVSFAGGVTGFEAFRNIDIGDKLMVAVGRSLIADAAFAEKCKIGATHLINHCQGIGHCHYFTRGKPALTCGVNGNLSETSPTRV